MAGVQKGENVGYRKGLDYRKGWKKGEGRGEAKKPNGKPVKLGGRGTYLQSNAEKGGTRVAVVRENVVSLFF